MSQDSIQAIFIKQTETKNDGKSYTAYRIDIQAAVRQWHIWKRYSDFVKLHQQLIGSFPGISIPAQLPQKRIFPPTFSAPERVEDRRQGLEDYLRTIQSCRDDRWRKTDIWVDFLALPATQEKKKELFSLGSWLDEYDDLLSLSREIRSLISSRNAHQSQHEVSDALRCDVKAKKDLMSLTARLSILEASLSAQKEDNHLVDGEERRREDKLSSLKSERDVLIQLVNVTRQDLTNKKPSSPPKKQTAASSAALLLGERRTDYGDIGFDQHVRRVKTVTSSAPRQGRAFGNALKQLQETEATKGLDNKELLSYQTQVMKDQDLHVEQFSQLLSRQKEIGLAINYELENQIDVLESLDIQVDNTSTKLAFANKKLSKIK
ncbi:Phox homologous domain-containing protein [Pilaira anomala]|nr:Phox homologous domain-containing protein [Pilaira anomala]